ncbi:MAG: succinate dehydrogenase, hydrophobic membrane anchor protein [Pseudomonadota bacterium]
MSYRTALQRATGHGSAKEGVEHWWGQRVTSIALIPLTPLFLFPLGRSLGGGHEAVLATYAHPLNALVAILFIVVSAQHLKQGLQVVIEDYVHGKGSRTAALLANTFLCWTIGLVGVFAVARIAL